MACPIEPTAVTTNQATCPTLSRNRAGAPATFSARATPRGNRERRTWVVATSASRSEPDTDRGEHHVDREQGDDAQHQGLVDGRAYALRAAGNCEASVAADQAGYQAEGHRLDHRYQYLRQPGDERERGDVSAGGDVLQVHAEDEATDQTDRDHRAVQQQRDERRGDDPGHHQPVYGIDDQNLQRVDLLTDGARAQVRANGRRPGPGDHEHGDQWPELGHGSQRRTGSGDVGGAELREQDVEREDKEHGQRYRHRDGGQERHPQQEPALEDELAPLERRPEQRCGGEHAHADETADRGEGRPGLFADIPDDAGGRRHRWTLTTKPRLSWRSGRPCRTPPPCPNPVCVTTVSLLAGSKTDHRTVPDAVPAVHRIGRIVPVTVSKPTPSVKCLVPQQKPLAEWNFRQRQ